jgi:hypothetical protein
MLTKAAICVTLLIGALVSVPVSAQPSSQSQDPTTKSRKVKDEPKKAFKQWLMEVEPILTQAEKDAWPKLHTDEEREQFIATVWRDRDPDPDTEENEFRDQYFERFAYVNEHFASGIQDRSWPYLPAVWKAGRCRITSGRRTISTRVMGRRRVYLNFSFRALVLSQSSRACGSHSRVRRSNRHRRIPAGAKSV